MSQAESPCYQCQRSRSKLETHLAEQGLIECKLRSEQPALTMQAYYEFSIQKQSKVIFFVKGKKGTSAAWPFQFHPTEIIDCAGRL